MRRQSLRATLSRVSWFDLGALAIVALFVVDGARSGLAWALLELTLLAGAALLSGQLQPFADPYVGKVIVLSQVDAPWATHAVVLAVVTVLLVGLGVLLQPLTKRWRFRFDGWPGGLVGAVTGAVAALVLFSLAIWSSPRPYEAQLGQGFSVRVLDRVHAAGLEPLFPSPLGHRLAELRSP